MFSKCKYGLVAEFKQKLETHDGTIYSLDETVFMLNHVPCTGWALHGRHVTQQKPGICGQRFSFLLCVRNNAANLIVRWFLMEGNVTAAPFHNVLSNLVLVNDNVMIMLDNAFIHKAIVVLRRQGISTITKLAKEQGITMNYL